MKLENINERIYEFFNSRDIAEYCYKIRYQFTAIETAYIVWHSNHHSLEEKHNAWREIINTMPDEQFHPCWDFDGYTLHSFLHTYMQLQNEFIKEFYTEKDGYIYSYETLLRYEDSYNSEVVFFDNYDACLESLKINEIEDDTADEIVKVKITRHKLYSSQVSFRDAQEQESIIFDKMLCPFDIETAGESECDKRFLSPSNGFYEMWIAVPTPFCKGDIVMDVNIYINCTKRHRPFILEHIPYWRKNADNGDNCEEEVERLLNSGVDWTDMQECVYLQDSNGEIYWDHAFNYLDMEYYREELYGKEKFLTVMSDQMKGKSNAEDICTANQCFELVNNKGVKALSVLITHIKNENKKYFTEVKETFEHIIYLPDEATYSSNILSWLTNGFFESSFIGMDCDDISHLLSESEKSYCIQIKYKDVEMMKSLFCEQCLKPFSKKHNNCLIGVWAPRNFNIKDVNFVHEQVKKIITGEIVMSGFVNESEKDKSWTVSLLVVEAERD